jgi:hypothetical protein
MPTSASVSLPSPRERLQRNRDEMSAAILQTAPGCQGRSRGELPQHERGHAPSDAPTVAGRLLPERAGPRPERDLASVGAHHPTHRARHKRISSHQDPNLQTSQPGELPSGYFTSRTRGSRLADPARFRCRPRSLRTFPPSLSAIDVSTRSFLLRGTIEISPSHIRWGHALNQVREVRCSGAAGETAPLGWSKE